MSGLSVVLVRIYMFAFRTQSIHIPTVTDLPHVGCQKFQLNEKDVYFSFLPLAHIFDRVSEEFYVYIGASIGFWQGVSLIVPPY